MPGSGFFLSQVDKLKDSLASMGELAGRQIADAVAAYVARDAILAQEVISRDSELDRLEDEHEELTIQIIALNQPVAGDLRMLVAFLRVNTSIERASDLAVNIAHTTLRLADKPPLRPYVDIPRTYDLVRRMWEDAIRCFATMDERLATELRDRDDQVDDINSETIRDLIAIGTQNPGQLYQVTNIIGVSKNLERAADLSVDIADEVVFVKSGKFRHARTQRSTA